MSGGKGSSHGPVKLYMLVPMLVLVLVSASALMLVSDEADSSVGDTAMIDGIWYEVIAEGDGVNEVSVMESHGGTYGDLVIPSTVTIKGVVYTVVEIGDGAFGSSRITSLELPETIRSIGALSFMSTTLESVVIPGSVETVGRFAFAFSSLKSLRMIAPVESMGDNAFYSCPNLQVIVLDGTVHIGNWAFANCSSLVNLAIPTSVRHIGDYAFSNCQNLNILTFYAGVPSIGDHAFSGAGDIRSITLPEGVTSIGAFAFSGCDGIDIVSLPSTLSHVGEGAFTGSGVISLTMDAAAGSGVAVVNRALLADGGSLLVLYCNNVNSYTVPEGVTRIGDGAFSRCTSLRTVTLPSSLESIGDSAFYRCGMYSIDIPSGVTSIGALAFSSCSSLSKLTIPSNVTSVGNRALINSGIDVVHIEQRAGGLTLDSIGHQGIEYASAEPGYLIGAFSDAAMTSWINNLNSFTGTAYFRFVDDDVSYTVEFDTMGGSAVDPITVGFGQRATRPADPVMENHAFTDWYTGPSLGTVFDFSTPIGGDTVLYAGWQRVGFTVSFDEEAFVVTAGGEQISSGSVVIASTQVVVEPVGKEGHRGILYCNGERFDGTISMPLEDATFTVEWELISYVVYFNYVFNSTTSAKYIRYGDPLVAPEVPYRDGYRFVGWSPEVPATMPARNLYFTAVWEECRSLTVTFDSNGGSTVDEQTVYQGDSAVEPEAPVRNGYRFTGWYTDRSCSSQYDFSTPVTDDIELYAGWAVQSYVLSFSDPYLSVSVGGSPVSSGDKVPFGTAVQVSLGVREGYSGTISTGLRESGDSYVMPARDAGIEVEWTANIHTATYDFGDGRSPVVIQVQYGAPVASPAKPERDGYVFLGWSPDKPSSMPDMDLHFTAVWQEEAPDQFIVEFRTNGGQPVGSQYIKEGESAERPSDPTLTGHTFTGWYTDYGCTEAYDFSSPVAGNLTLYAGWSVNSYTLIYSDEYLDVSVSGSVVPSGSTVRYGEEVAVALGEREGHTGTVLVNGAETDGRFHMPPGDVVITVLWDVVSHTVTVVVADGDSTSVSVEHGSAVPLPPQPARDGYVFTGWYSDRGCTSPYDPSAPVTGDITVYAGWAVVEVESHTVSFISNGGSPVSSQVVADGGTAAVPPEPSREGHTFTGWYADPDCTMPYHFSQQVVGDLVLYAGWDVDSYTVRYSGEGFEVLVGGDRVPSGAQVRYGDTVTVALEDREGQTRTVLVNGAEADAVFTMPAADVAVTVVWTELAYEMTFDFGGGDVHVERLPAGSQVHVPDVPVRDGYALVGWTDGIPQRMPSRDVEVEAVWSPVGEGQVAVVFDAEGGTFVGAQVIDAGGTVSEPQQPLRDGYFFTGWFSDVSCTAPFDFSEPVSTDTALFAGWSESAGDVPQDDLQDDPQDIPSDDGGSGGTDVMVLAAAAAAVVVAGAARAVLLLRRRI